MFTYVEIVKETLRLANKLKLDCLSNNSWVQKPCPHYGFVLERLTTKQIQMINHGVIVIVL